MILKHSEVHVIRVHVYSRGYCITFDKLIGLFYLVPLKTSHMNFSDVYGFHEIFYILLFK